MTWKTVLFSGALSSAKTKTFWYEYRHEISARWQHFSVKAFSKAEADKLAEEEIDRLSENGRLMIEYHRC